jgi:hypothetical protein
MMTSLLFLAVAPSLDVAAFSSGFASPPVPSAAGRNMCALQLHNLRTRAGVHRSVYGGSCIQGTHCETFYDGGESF